MAKYRKRPDTKEVEAFQFNPLSKHKTKLPKGVQGNPSPGSDNWAYIGCKFFVTTIHDHLTPIVAGDWIITEPDGVHHYPCKPDIFEATYEKVE